MTHSLITWSVSFRLRVCFSPFTQIGWGTWFCTGLWTKCLWVPSNNVDEQIRYVIISGSWLKVQIFTFSCTSTDVQEESQSDSQFRINKLEVGLDRRTLYRHDLNISLMSHVCWVYFGFITIGGSQDTGLAIFIYIKWPDHEHLQKTHWTTGAGFILCYCKVRLLHWPPFFTVTTTEFRQ